MGKKIDYFVLTAGITAALFLYLLPALGSIAALIVSLMGCIILNRIIRGINRALSGCSFMKKRRLRKDSRSALMFLASMEEASACEKLSRLIEKIYGRHYNVAVIQCHPSTALHEEDIFHIWKQNRNCEELIICATGHSDAGCRSLASELHQPKTALIDAGALSQLIAEHPEGMFPENNVHFRRRLKLQHIRDLFLNRKNAPRCLLMFLSMLMIYIFSGNIFYLFGAMFLLFVALASLKRQHRPYKLF